MKLHRLVPAVGALALVAAGAATPAHAAGAGGRVLQTFDCDGQETTFTVSTGNEGDNWGAARVVGGGTLIPVSLEYLVYDDTAALVLDDEIVQHGGPAHAQQPTVTCVVTEQAVLGDVAPPDFVLPDGVAASDLVTSALYVIAVPRP
jgi:hypothetical protein